MEQVRNFFINVKFKKGNNQFSFFTLNLRKKELFLLFDYMAVKLIKAAPFAQISIIDFSDQLQCHT